ncbi:uncharacterized protein LOC143294891 [Babylonia areolata]|uniref:uncharacterized protein LOC143294891 n=1 Tax=Babylonia areolata TaxID=304850 RepID=UPI003FD03ED2
MAPPTSAVLLFLLLSTILLFFCQASPQPDPSEPPTSPPTSPAHQQQQQHHHRHRHHHGDLQDGTGQRAASEDVRDDVTVPGHDSLQRGGEEAEGAGGDEKGDGQGARETTPERGRSSSTVAMTTQPAPSEREVGVEGGQQSSSRPDPANTPQSSAGHKPSSEERPGGAPLTTTSLLRPESAPNTPTPTVTTPSPESRQSGLQSAVENKHANTTTERNLKGFSTRRPNNDQDAKDVDRASLSTSAESSDEKLVNRPRWRHILRQNNEEKVDEDDPETDREHLSFKHNASHHRTNSTKHVLPVPEDPESASAHRDSAPPQPGPTADPHPAPDPVPRRWSGNRPRWDNPDKQSAEHPEPGDLPSPLKGQKKGKTDRQASKRKMVKKKKKKKKQTEREDLAEPHQDVKQKRKWKSKKKSGPLSKGCPGCSPTEVKLAEARELHKQVLKAQLLDKLRLVPTFQRQPWPPKLPDEVFSDVAQHDQGGHRDRYYARPTQLLLFGRDLGPRHRLKKASTGSYKFGVRGKVTGAVRSARLWVYKMKDARDPHGQTLVITELQRLKRWRLRERSLVARLETHVREGWVSFDVTRLVRRWVQNEAPTSSSSSSSWLDQDDPHLLAIRCKTCQRTNYRAIFGVKSHFRPVLVIREQGEGEGGRERRRACDPNTSCCRFDMTVSFEELGIHAIFRPLAIKADYCFGTCERPDAHHYNHTVIVQRMRFNSHVSNATLRDRLQPCCVPVVLREATIFHYLNSGLDSQVSLVPNLLVDRCGCA